MPIRLSNIRKTQDTAIGADGLDSAQVSTIASGVGIQSFDTLDSLPISSLTAGDRAFVKANKRLYISNGSGWYNVALINLTPTMSLSPSGTITLSTDGTASTVTITASDSDGVDADLTFSVESDGNMVGTGTTVTQDSSVFTITPLTADSGGVAGDFTLTFKTSDVFNTATQNASFSLAFSNVVDSSSLTTFLMKATGNSAVNSAITYQNASDVSTGFTETDNGGGGPQASTFSPFRSGGYSLLFDGTGDYLQFDLGANGGPNADFTIEFWAYHFVSDQNDGYFMMSDTSGGFKTSTAALSLATASNYYRSYSDGTNLQYTAGSDTKPSDNVNSWTHLALVRSGTNQDVYVNGTKMGTTRTTSTDYSSYRYLVIGGYYNNTLLFEGYIKDFRYVKGTAVYTAAFTPPTEPLEAITNTELLVGQLPWLGDKSTNAHTITYNGNVSIEPFSPYNYEPWNSTDFISSVYVPYSDHLKVSDYSTVADFGANNFTLEGWFWSDGNNNQYQMFFSGRATSTYRLIVFGDNNTIAVYLSTSGSGWTHYNTNCGTFKEKNWTHIALVRNGGTVTLYVNGKGTNVTTSLGSGSLAAPTAFFIGSDFQTTNAFGGYVSDARVVKGTAVYSSDFTPPTAPLTAVTNTQLLMQNKTDANVYDASASRVLKLFNDTVSSTTQRKFSTSSSVYFDGTGDYATSPDGATLEFKNSDFTIELWMYKTSTAASVLVQKRSTGSAAGDWTLLAEYAGTDFEFWSYDYNSFGSVMLQGGTISQNTWHHVAVTRYGSTWTMWVDGTSVATLTSTITIGESSAPLTIGRDNYGSGTRYFPGYIQDLRITKGAARYTANFTAPTAEFSL